MKYYSLDFVKPDGRKLSLYGLEPIYVASEIPSPSSRAIEAKPVMRWHSLRAEWVIYATHRMERTFLPPVAYNPLSPTQDPDSPTELPRGKYDIAVFENRFPSLKIDAKLEEGASDTSRAGVGACEVVVFSQQSGGSLCDLTNDQIRLLVQVWADRTTLFAKQGLKSALCFENRGVEVGVTLEHPHGQIYAYDHVPSVQAQILKSAKAHWVQRGNYWLDDFVEQQRELGSQVLMDNGHAISLVPPFARYSYETWVIPARAVSLLSELNPEELVCFAAALKDALLRLDALFGVRMPYLLTLHQAPLDGSYPEFPMHIEIYPYLRAKNKLKYLAGTEQGAGVFANDKLPEDAAAELRGVRL